MSLKPPRRLLLPLLAALAAHGLWLSWAQLQENQQRRRLQATGPLPRDNTPELLRFSRQAGLTPGLATVALPPAATLPPPTAGVSATRAAGASALRAAASLDRPPKPSQPRAAAAAARRGGGVPKPALARGAAPPRSDAEVSDAEASNADADKEEAVLTVLQQLRRQLGPAAGAPAAAPPPPRLEGPTAAAYRRLWNGSQPARPGGSALAGLPAGVESRRANRTLLQRLKLSTGHRQAVVLDEHLLLFWQEEGDTWLLRLPLDDGKPAP
jgi:hypothetical protein